MIDFNNIENLKKQIKLFYNNDFENEAFGMYKKLDEYLNLNNIKENNYKLYNEYYDCLIKLKLICLQFFNWDEIILLIEKYIDIILEFENYDLVGKIRSILLAFPDYVYIDNAKNELKKIILESSKVVIDRKKYISYLNFPLKISEWLKDYISNRGKNNLERIKYFTNSDKFKKLAEIDKIKIKSIFNLYDLLEFTSEKNEGLIGDLPIIINGKYFIFNDGKAEEITSNIFKLIKSINVNNSKDELTKLASQYPEDSLERKAIEEEIKKLGG